jgi:hypothetical protein
MNFAPFAEDFRLDELLQAGRVEAEKVKKDIFVSVCPPNVSTVRCDLSLPFAVRQLTKWGYQATMSL